MTTEAAAEKKQRSIAKSNFTRKLNIIEQLITDEAQSFLVKEQYDKMKACFEKLEDTHEAFINVTDIDIDDHADGNIFMDDQQARYNDIVKKYSAYLKTSDERERTQSKKKEEDDVAAVKAVQQQERKERVQTETTKLEVAIETFRQTNEKVTDSMVNAPVLEKQAARGLRQILTH